MEGGDPHRVQEKYQKARGAPGSLTRGHFRAILGPKWGVGREPDRRRFGCDFKKGGGVFILRSPDVRPARDAVLPGLCVQRYH